MSRGSFASPSKGSRFDTTDEDLDLFCKLEKVIRDENSGLDASMKYRESERSRLAQEFPDCFVENSDSHSEVTGNEIAAYQEMYKELESKIAYVNQKKAEVDRNASFLAKERKELERERARIEKDKVIAATNLANVELIELRKKYNALKQVYEEEKRQWEAEREKLLAQIEAQEGSIHVTMDVAPKVVPAETKTPVKEKRQVQKKTTAKKPVKEQLNENYPLDFTFNPGVILKEEPKSDGRKLIRYKNGMTATRFRNGTIKMKNKDVIYVFYENGDKAIEFSDGARGYWYKETDTTELSLPDKTVMYQFSNGQIERHFPNGDKAVQYPNGQFKIMHKNGDYEVHHPSGKTEKCTNGHLVITFDE